MDCKRVVAGKYDRIQKINGVRGCRAIVVFADCLVCGEYPLRMSQNVGMRCDAWALVLIKRMKIIILVGWNDKIKKWIGL